MTREFEPDPEVLADIALRDRTAAERPPAPASLYAWKAPEDVGAWKCRTCGALCGVTADDLEYAAMWNRILKRRGEQPLEPDKIVFCGDCRVKFKAKQGDKNLDRAGRIRDEIRKLKAADEPRLERDTISTLRQLGHPDVDGLLEALSARARAKGAKKGKAKL